MNYIYYLHKNVLHKINGISLLFNIIESSQTTYAILEFIGELTEENIFHHQIY